MLATACAHLGIIPKHTRPYKPQGRGKIERYFGTADRQWGREAQALIEHGRLTTLDKLQEFFAAWLHSEYNARVHSSTNEAPEARWRHVHPDHPITWVDPPRLASAFFWMETRVVTAVGTISLEGNDFEVSSELARRKITVRYDPYDLSAIHIEWEGKDYGVAKPLGHLPEHSRHVRAPEVPESAPTAERTRFDTLVREHDEQQRFEQAGRMSFAPQKPADATPRGEAR